MVFPTSIRVVDSFQCQDCLNEYAVHKCPAAKMCLLEKRLNPTILKGKCGMQCINSGTSTHPAFVQNGKK